MPISQINQPKRTSGTRKAHLEITTFEEATRIHLQNKAVNGYPPNAVSAMDILVTAGVLTTAQLHALLPVSVQTMSAYQRKGYLISTDYLPALNRFPLKTGARNRLWTLGLLGIARAVDLDLAADNFRGYSFKQTEHDILLNEVAIELLTQAAAKSVKHTWFGTYEGRARDADGSVVIEPDALLIFGAGEAKQGYAIEYHNEEDRRRAFEKVARYEAVERSRKCTLYWDVNTMPTIVVVTTSKIVLKGYIDALRARGQSDVRCHYVAKTFEKFANNRQEATTWSDLNKRAFEKSFESVTLF